jgi:peptidyl-prolyl cis-trans isomerase SurA
MTRILFGAALAVLLGLPAQAQILEQIIVKVNGEIFTKTDLEERQVAALRARNRFLTSEDVKNDAELQKALEEVTPSIIADVIDELLILQQGRERGYRLGDEQFAGIVERIRKENKLESDEAFQAALRQEGLTMAELRRNMERQMVVSRVQNDAIGRVSVSDEEAQRYYEQHPTEFSTPASLTIRELLVEVATTQAPAGGARPAQPAFNAAQDEEARQEAEALRKRALAGEDFAKLAAAESDAASKANGGLIGPINQDELAESLQKLLGPLKAGDISEIVRTPRGYQFFKVESVSPTTILPFEQAREEIANKVFAEKRGAEFAKYMQRLREQAIIEWKNDEIKRLYEKHMAQPAPAKPSL